MILFCLPSKRINKESILLYLPACFIKIEYCSIFFFTNLFIDLIFLSIYLKVYTILLGLKPKRHLLFSHFLYLLKEILILPPPGIFINFPYFHSLLWITFFFLSTIFSTGENKRFFFFLVDSSFILYFSTDFELTTAKIFNFRGIRYSKKNNFTDKIQQILPSKSVKNSDTLADQENPKNLLEELILNTTHPSSPHSQLQGEVFILQAQQALASLTETFGSNSIMYRLLSEKISTHPLLHSSFT